MPTAPSQCDMILTALSSGEWISMPELARISGSLNIHSRIDQLRHDRGMIILNHKTSASGSRRIHSFYRLITPEGCPSPQTPQPLANPPNS